MRRGLPIRAAALLVICLVSACGGDPGSTASTSVSEEMLSDTTVPSEDAVTETQTSVVITVTGLVFPVEVTVPPGKSVTWINESSAPHEVQMETFEGALADEEPVRLGTDEEGGLTLEPGTWTYFCTIHPSMTGTLVVEG
jgi:plastocyanin